MGTDISAAIQVYDGGRWVDQMWQRPLHTWEVDRQLHPDAWTIPHLGDRDYPLFAILADVRNDNGSGWPPIAARRGFPADFDPDEVKPNPEVDLTHPRLVSDCCATWVLLSEIEAYPWLEVFTVEQWLVSADQFITWQDTQARPRMMWMASNRPWVDMDDFNRNNPEHMSSDVRVRWRKTAYAACPYFVDETIPALRGIAKGRPLRLVMGFD